MKFIKPILLLLLLCPTWSANAQKQLIVLNKESVLLRLYPGDEFIYKLKGSKTKRITYVNNLSNTAVITHRDTVPFHAIDRIYFKQRRFYNTIGVALVIFGSGLFVIDQINMVVVNGQSPDLDSQVSALSLGSLAAGLPMALLRKRSQKIRYRTRMMVIEKGSAFYRPDTRENIE